MWLVDKHSVENYVICTANLNKMASRIIPRHLCLIISQFKMAKNHLASPSGIYPSGTFSTALPTRRGAILPEHTSPANQATCRE